MSHLALYALGPVRLERDGDAVAMDTRKATALLVYLVLTGERHTRDTLAGLLWPDYDQSHARATLRRTLSALKEGIGAAALDSAHDSIGLAPDADLVCDVTLFRALIAACAGHGHAVGEVCVRCVAPLEQAAALYRGDLLAGFSLRDSPVFDDWQIIQQESLRRELAGALDRLARAHAGQHAWDAAIAAARRRLALDRLHEPAHRLLMQLYARAGQRTAALRQYRECVQVLDRELGVAPLDSTTRLYEAIRERQAERPIELRSTPVSAPVGPLTLTRAPEGPQADGVAAATAATVAPAPPLVGRVKEWERLRAAYDAAETRGQVVALEGEAGIGKTRLAEELLAHARERGVMALAVRCYEGEAALAYAPVMAALRAILAEPRARAALEALPDAVLAEAARLVPDVARRPAVAAALAAAPPLETPGAQTRFFEGLARALAAGGASDGALGVLVFDDLQWADGASLDVLTYLARRLDGHRICLLLDYREGGTPTVARLRALLAEAQRAGNGTTIALARLTPDAMRALARSRLVGEAAPAEGTIARLCAEAEGLPFFLVEYLAALEQGVLAPDAAWSLPGGARDLLRSRLGAVSESSGQVLTAAAVIGRSFDEETLRAVSGRGEEEVVAALEELAGRGLVREVRDAAGRRGAAGTPSFDFTHEKLRALVYEETSLARRRLLHRRAAEALVARARGGLAGGRADGNLAGQIAGHFLQAGNDAQAAVYEVDAGERARALYANREALEHFQTALALGHSDAAALHQRIGDLHTLLGDYAAALASYETAAALAPPSALPAIEHTIGGVYLRRGEWERAQAHLEAALEALDALDGGADVGMSAEAGERARILADGSLAARQRQRAEEAERLAREALRLAEGADDPLAQAQAHNMLGMLASGAGQLDEATQHLERSLALASEGEDAAARAAALNNLALAYAARGEGERARECAEAALALAVARGDRHREAALHNNLADLWHRAGQPEAAMAHLKQAVAIYAEIGVEAGTIQPEIWKLVEW